MARLTEAQRKEIVQKSQYGMGTTKLSREFKVSERTIQRVMKKHRETEDAIDVVDDSQDEFTSFENMLLKAYYGFGLRKFTICTTYSMQPEELEKLLMRCPTARIQHLTSGTHHRIRSSFASGTYISDIAKEFKTTEEVINKILYT